MNKGLLLAAIAIGVTCNAFAAPGIPYTDEWIEGRISGAYAYNDQIDSSNIKVDSDGGAVTISGKVPSEVEKQFAENVARSVDGVSSVRNDLAVDESLKLSDRSSFGQKLSDATTTASIKAKLLAHKDVHGLDINVDTVGDVVTLSGDIHSKKEGAIAENIAFNTNGVREVKNNLRVVTSSGAALKSEVVGKNEESKDAQTAITDAWISTKVRSILAFDTDFPGANVDVTTTNGKVKLEGIARSSEQKQRIGEVVADVSGVHTVDNKLVIKKRPA